MGTEPRRRQSAEKTRELMLARGCELLSEHGLELALGDLSIDRCLEELDVARSSAYNAWSDSTVDARPQELFQREVLKAFILDIDDPDPGDSFAVAVASMQSNPAIGTREALRRELTRIAGNRFLQSVVGDRRTRVRASLIFAATSVPAASVDEELIDWLCTADDERRKMLVASALRPTMLVCGLRPRPELDGAHFWEHFSTVVFAFAIGMLPRAGHLSSVASAPLLIESGGEERDWSLFSVGMDALFEAFFVNNPNADVALPSEADL